MKIYGETKMSNNKKIKEFNLNNIFLQDKYVIPIYQRNYAWEADEIEQLLNDINDFGSSNSDDNYYLGSLIVDEIGENRFSVIDGQQRLTTIFLLLSYLGKISQKDALTFEAREKSNITLRELSKNMTKTDFYSQEIIDGYNIIENFFKEKEEKERNFKENFKGKLSNISMIRTQVPKNIDLNHYFEIMNTRGEQLEIHEIAKGRILSIIDKEKPKYKAMVALIWDKCAKMDSYIQMNFDIKIRKWIFGDNWDKFEWKNFDDILNNDEIKQFLSKQDIENKTSLCDMLEKHKNVKEIDDDENSENERFEPIITFANFLLIINEAMPDSKQDDDASLDDKKFIKTLEKHWKSGENALNFVFNMLKFRFLFDKYIIKREIPKNYNEDSKWSLQKLKQNQDKPSYVLTYQDDEKTQILRILQSALRITYTSPKTMHWIAKALFELNKDESVNLIEILEKYACEKVRESNFMNTTGFAIERIVFTYLDYVLIRDKKVQNMTIDNFQFQFRNSIEHFYPQNPANGVRWENDKGEPLEALNCFGNLALITVSGNSQFLNFIPKDKVKYWKDVKKQSPKLQIMSEKANDWSEEVAKKHGDEMLKLLEKEIKDKLKI